MKSWLKENFLVYANCFVVSQSIYLCILYTFSLIGTHYESTYSALKIVRLKYVFCMLQLLLQTMKIIVRAFYPWFSWTWKSHLAINLGCTMKGPIIWRFALNSIARSCNIIIIYNQGLILCLLIFLVIVVLPFEHISMILVIIEKSV